MPLLQDLASENFLGRIVVIASRMPLDLEDCSLLPISKQVLLVYAFSDPFQTEFPCVDAGSAPDAVQSVVDEEATDFRIQGDGFFPLAFDLRGGTGQPVAVRGDRSFSLRGRPAGAKLDLQLTALVESSRYPDCNLVLRYTTPNGEHEVRGQFTTPGQSMSEWKPLAEPCLLWNSKDLPNESDA